MLALEVLAVLGVLWLFVALRARRQPALAALPLASYVVIGALTVAFALGELPRGASLLVRAHRSTASPRTGLEDCFRESWPGNPHGVGQAQLPFVRWARATMGPRAVYALDQRAAPDAGCLYLALLPALPARPGQRANWTVAFGRLPAPMRARVAARDRSVSVFAPGFALQSNGRR